MPLKIELKPGERLIIGNTLITNDKDRVKFFIEGNVPILREKYVLSQKEANTPCKRLYFTLQEMYLAKDPKALHATYFDQIAQITKAAPSLAMKIDVVNQNILEGDYYNALKNMMKVIEAEEKIMNFAAPAQEG